MEALRRQWKVCCSSVDKCSLFVRNLSKGCWEGYANNWSVELHTPWLPTSTTENWDAFVKSLGTAAKSIQNNISWTWNNGNLMKHKIRIWWSEHLYFSASIKAPVTIFMNDCLKHVSPKPPCWITKPKINISLKQGKTIDSLPIVDTKDGWYLRIKKKNKYL